MKIERWKLETREAGITVSRAFFTTEEEARQEAQKRRDEHIGLPRAYLVSREILTV